MIEQVTLTEHHTIKDLPENMYRDYIDFGIHDMFYSEGYKKISLVLDKVTIHVKAGKEGLELFFEGH